MEGAGFEQNLRLGHCLNVEESYLDEAQMSH